MTINAKSFYLILCSPFLIAAPLLAQLGNVTGITSDSTSITLNVGSDVVKVRMLLPNVAEVDYRPNNVASPNTIIIDPTHASKTWAPGAVTINTASDPATLTTSSMQVRIQKNPLRVSYYTLGGQLIFKEQASAGMSTNGVKFDGWSAGSLNWYGLQSAGSGRAWESSAAATYWGWSHVNSLKRNGVSASGSEFSTPNMNVMPQGGQTGPFAWTLGGGSTPGFAVIWDNEGGSAVLGNALEMSKDNTIGTPLQPKTSNLWFGIVGSPYQIMDAMTQITGRPTMFPKYSQGFINTEWGVDENELKTSIETYRERKIPLDVYTLDFDWKHWGEFNYGEFKWNPDKFPSAASGGLKDFFDEKGAHIMGITKPRIHRNTPQGDYAFAQGWFNGQNGPGDPIHFGNDYFSARPIGNLRFTSTPVREWFAQQTVDGAYATGVEGWWNDEFEEQEIRRAEAGSVYNVALQKHIYDYQRQQFPTKRVWTNNRCSYLGSQRYGYSVWSGDVTMAWGQLAVEPVRMLQVINAGLGRTSTDGGGTSGGINGTADGWDNSDQNGMAAHMPLPELYARWIQFSSFMPIFRTHGANPLAQRQPWYFNHPTLGNGEIGAVEAIRFRSRLIPYIYSFERQYAESGIPIVRPLNWDSPTDANLANYSDAWMFGDGLLVAPIIKKQATETNKSIYLPSGTWYDYFRGTTYVSSGGNITYNTLDPLWFSMPVFAKAGAIIPNYFHTPQYVGEGDKTQLQVEYFPSTSSTTFNYYDDDGVTNSYESNQFFKQAISAQQSGSTVNVNIAARTGSTFTPALQHYIVAIQRFKGSSATIGGSAATQRTDLASLRSTAGEGWALGSNVRGAVTYVKVAAGVVKAISATQSVAPSLAITTATLPAGLVNEDYEATLFAEGLGNTVTWSITSGTLPAGLTFDAKTARIIGRPTTPGTSNLTFQLVSGSTVTKSLSVTVGYSTVAVYEPFDYQGVGNGLEGTQGGAGMVDMWQRKLGSLFDNPKFPTQISFGNNSYGSLPYAGNRAKLVTGSSGNRYARVLQTPFVDDNSPKTVWLSFIGTGTGAGSGGLSLTRTAGTSTDSLLVFGKSGSTNWTYDAKVGSQPSAPSSVPASTTPAFILAKIDIINSSTRTVRMWVNPTLSGTAPSDASANIITNQGTNNLSFGRLELTFSGQAGDSLDIDEIRLGSNYTDVVVLTQPPVVWKYQKTTEAVTSLAYNYQVIASGIPTSWALTGGSIPTGLSLNTATGIVSGTPTTAGTYTATVTATNANGTSSSVSLKFTVILATAPTIVSGQSSTGQSGQGFSYTLQATGYATSWALSGSTLPPGLVLNTSTGVVSGTPTAAGLYITNFTSANAQGTSPVSAVTFNITSPLAGLVYDQTGGIIGSTFVGLGGGGGTVGWGSNTYQTLNSGTFRVSEGLTYPGVPSVANSLSIDGGGYVGFKRKFASTISRNGQTTWISMLVKVNRIGNEGIFAIEIPDYTGQQLQILADTGVPNWVIKRQGGATVQSNAPVISGQTALVLLKLDMNGASSSYRMWVNPPVDAQPTDASANATLINQGSFDMESVQSVQIGAVTICFYDEFRLGATWADVMGAPPIITPNQNPSAMQTIPYSYQVAAAPAATSWTLISGSLPSGLSFNTTTGVISGTVTTTGTFPIVVRATNATGNSSNQTVTISAVPLAQPSVATGQSTSGVVGTAFSYQINASYAISYNLSSGTLPPGVTLNASSGLLSGTPTTAGSYTPAFTVTNSAGTSSAVSIPITVTQLIAYDGFSYTAGTLAGRNGGTGWTQAWDSGQNETNTTGMSYTSGDKNLIVSGGKVIVKDGGSFTNYRSLPASYSTGTYWLSFIAKSNLPGSGYGGVSIFNDSNEQLFIGQRFASTNWGVERSGAGATTTTNTGAPTFIVVKLVLKAGGDDVYIWTNPSLDTVPTDVSATKYLGAADITANRIRLQGSLSSTQFLEIDEFRFGNTFAEVAPTTPTVAPAPVITASQTATGTLNQSFSYTVVATNNPTSWTTTGTLPAGVTFNTTTGVLSGTPTATGVFTPSFTATNVSGTSASQSISLTITNATVPVIANGQTATGTVNTAMSFTPSVTNSPTSWALTGALPTGVNFNTSTGVISGTPTVTGTFSPSLTATSGAGTSPAQTITITINAAAVATNYKIMTAGDSITANNNYQNTMRSLFGSSATWVGTLGTAPNKHEGWSGKGLDHFNWGTAGGSTSIRDYMNTEFGTSAAPTGTMNVVTLMLGINNMDHGLGVPGGGSTGFPDVNSDGSADGPKLADNSGHDAWITGQVNQLVDSILNHPSNVKLVIAKIPPVGRGRDSLAPNFAAAISRINRLNATYQTKYDSLSTVLKERVRIVDHNSIAVREYGNAPTNDWGTETEQQGDWVHPRPNAGLWSEMGQSFYNSILSFNAPTRTVSGTVTLNSSGLSGVSVSAGSTSAVTDTNGNYTLNLPDGSYTFTPSREGYSFSPTNLSVTLSGANQTGKNFTATALPTYSISGAITLSGSGVSGVTVSNGNGITATTDGSGNYTLAGIPQGSYTITPTKVGYVFSPVSLSGTISSNLTGQNFVATLSLATYEGFNYSAGAGALASKTGGNNWNGAWDSGANDINATGLSYTSSGTLTTSGGKAVIKDGVASFRTLSASAYGNGTYWVSFLAKSSAPGTNWGGLSFYNGSGNETLFLGQRYGQSNWGIERSGSGVNTSTNTGTTTYMVAKIVLQAGTDSIYLWTNPSLNGTPSDASATQLLNVTDFSFDRIRLMHGLGSGQTLEIDEIRFAQSYAEVAPTLGSSPVITASQTASGTQGQAFSYQILASNSPTSWALSSGSLPSGVTLGSTTGILSGTPTVAGSFTPSFTATNGAGTSPAQSVSINLAAASGLISFRSSYSLAANGSQDNAMLAGDGVANLLKYAFNMMGAGTGQAAALATPNAKTLAAGGIAGLPLVNTDGSGKLQITYVRRKAASNAGITYNVEFSNDLSNGSWASNGSAVTGTPVSIDADYERVTVTDSLTQAKRFVRVKITTP